MSIKNATYTRLLLCTILVIAIGAQGSRAQKSSTKTDNVILRCAYSVTKRLPKDGHILSRDTLLLDIGSTISRFYDPVRLQRDSLLSVTAFKRNESEKIQEVNIDKEGFTDYSHELGTTSSDLSNGESAQILKDNSGRKIKVLDILGGMLHSLGEMYQYEEDYPSIDWKIDSATINVLNYSCQRAKARFRGREYTVWFAPEIPLMDGPWKFRGLPGLILKAEDDQELFSYEAVGIEKPVSPIQISPVVDERYTKCTREQYQKLKKKQPKTVQVYFNAGILHITRPPREGELLLQETE